MNKRKRSVPGIRDYDAPAGGWGALKATAIAVRTQMDTFDAAVTLLRTNQPDGFDCPGCAWPDKDHTSTFQFCENGAKAVTWEATRKRITPEFFTQHTVKTLLAKSDFELEGYGRLTAPLRYDRVSDTFLPVEWEDAFERIGEILRELEPEQVEFYTSGRASNEAAFLYQLFAREYGSNNFPDCSNMCHEATSVGLPRSIGIGKGTVSLDDFEKTELVISVGHNPGTNHPRMMGTLHDLARRGVPIIVFNPLRETALERFADPQNIKEMVTGGAIPVASSYLQVKSGGDAAALKGIARCLLALDREHGNALDHDFIARHTQGFDDFSADIERVSWPVIEHESGLSKNELMRVAEIYAKSDATIITYGMGITQHNRGTANVRLLTDLLLLRGNIGKPGAGICPLRGHSNVQGNRTVGITEKPERAFLERLQAVSGFIPPSVRGHNAVQAMQAMTDGSSKALICLGGNFAVAMPDHKKSFAALKSLELSVHIGTRLNRTHLLAGKETFIFPCLGRTEYDLQRTGRQSVTVEDSMSMVHASTGKLEPVSEMLRSEPAIVAGIAEATLKNTRIDWSGLTGDYSQIRDLIEQTVPGFEDFNARIRIPGGFRLPLPPVDRVWPTPSGKAMFSVYSDINEDIREREDNALRMISLRSHDQYNTTIYGMDDRYRGVYGRRDILFMNENDMQLLGIEHGDRVDVTTTLPDHDACLEDITVVAYRIAQGTVGAYYPEMNVLVPLNYIDEESGMPSYKSVPVKITLRSKEIRTLA
ncbi:CbbBc protein [Salmonella enterica subsp. enterica serovar Newport]|nr:CbbBc protein [Salmonella enterica subsp. enterica serovar Newport]MJR82213.1 CbbBc protein [Salmonella enterica subsp. enterica serovar Newport]HAE2415175.1 FdhF/YdeP family oxidoreductase [Salmonella enterica subsp. enterica serovar Newport]